MKVIALIGSPRKGGNTDCLTDAFFEGVRQVDPEADCEKLYMDDLNIRPCPELGDDFATRVDTRADDEFRRTAELLLQADILLWGAPVYWQGVPAQMKCFVDRWSCYYAAKWLNQGMADKVWAVVCCYGHPSQDESHWVIEPIKAWTHRWRGNYTGDVCVGVAKKGAVAQMSDAMARAVELGRRAAEAAQ